MMLFSMLSIAGEPLPYSFRDDDLITGALLVCFLIINWVAAGSWRFVRNYGKGFFRPRERENLFAAEDENKLKGSLPLIVLTSFLVSIHFFRHLQEQTSATAGEAQPHEVMGLATGIVFAYYFLKLLVYAIVNTVFFDRWQRSLWRQDYLMNVFCFGFALFPLTLLVVYLDLGHRLVCFVFIGLLVVLKCLLLYRCMRIFFDSGSRSLHLFLYFCTLEMAPLLFLWRILLFADHFLTTIY